MAIRLRDRVKQGTVSTGTGTITLSTSFVTFQDFSDVLSDGDTTYYTIENSNDFEVGEGTYSGNTLSRDQVFSSSNTGSLISLAGSSTVFITYPASKSVHLNGSGNVTGIECIDFKLGVTPAYSEGRVFYDNVSHALAVYNDEADITLQVGQEEYLRVRNNSATVILNGQVVRVAGSQGTNPTVELAIATDFDSSNVVGVATHDIENNSFGYVTTFGLVNDVDTSDFAEGSELYLSPSVSGGFTGVAPSAPFYQSPVGVCVRQHPSVGAILVQPKATKLGGFDVKSLGNIQNSGVPFISEAISESSGAILATNTGFYYSVSTDTLNAVNVDVAETINANSVVVEDGGSYKIYNLGQEGDADTEYLETYWDTNVAYIEPKATGSGTTRNLTIGSTSGASVTNIQGATVRLFDNATLMQNIDSSYNTMYNGVRPNFDGTVTLGYDGRRWSNVASVNGDFSGTVTVDTINASGSTLDLQLGGSSVLRANAGFSYYYAGGGNTYILQGSDFIRPQGGAAPFDLGGIAHRWRTVFGEDGSFSGNLTSEVGGSYKLYNFGTDGDVDTEFGTTEFSSDVLRFGTKTTGSGVARDVGIMRDGSYKLYIGSSEATIYQRLVPISDASYSLGKVGRAWSNVYSVDGSFNGLLNASGISVDVGGSFNMYSLGADGDADTESLSIDYDAPSSRWLISSDDPTGTGLSRQLWFDASQIRMYETNTLLWIGESNQMRMYGDIVPSSDGLRNLGTSSRKFLGVNAINGDFSGTLTTDFMQSNSGSFSGDLVSETGASHRFYRLGAEGDANVEYMDMGWDGNDRFIIGTQEAGTGIGRDVRVTAGLTRVDLTNDGNLTLVRNNATYMILGSANITVYRYFRPNSDLGVDFGSEDRRWGDGYFGHLQSDTITLSGLPYSDPANSGQIWQSGQYLRISHG